MGRNRGVGESSLQILKLGCSSVLSTYFVILSNTTSTFSSTTSTTAITTSTIPETACNMNYHSSLYHDNCHNITVDNSDKASIVVNT